MGRMGHVAGPGGRRSEKSRLLAFARNCSELLASWENFLRGAISSGSLGIQSGSNRDGRAPQKGRRSAFVRVCPHSGRKFFWNLARRTRRTRKTRRWKTTITAKMRENTQKEWSAYRLISLGTA